MPDTAIRFENAQPILRVQSIPTALRFYVDILGFQNAPWGSDDFTCISRDQAVIYLCRGDQGRGGAWIWIGVDGDIGQLHEDLKARGVAIRLPPSDHSWAVEMQVEDPDGNVVRFGAEPR
jgi:catechol 2,3-dioxygenase-like lactoylglutathione lyase family enzyme